MVLGGPHGSPGEKAKPLVAACGLNLATGRGGVSLGWLAMTNPGSGLVLTSNRWSVTGTSQAKSGHPYQAPSSMRYTQSHASSMGREPRASKPCIVAQTAPSGPSSRP